jgi:hypothetical protein
MSRVGRRFAYSAAMNAGMARGRRRARRLHLTTASILLAATAAVAAGCGVGAGPSVDAPSGSNPAPSRAATATITAPAPSRSLDPARQPPSAATSSAPLVSPGQPTGDVLAFADAYRTLTDAYARARDDIIIANPLSEFDLVGNRLIDLLEATRSQLAGLPRLDVTAEPMRRLDQEMAATLRLLRALEPHGPRAQQAEQYQQALDYWIDHVVPVANEIRAAVGLPRSQPVDLGL